MRRPTGQQLTVACSSGVSMFWLTPRLSQFIERYPDIQLRLIVRDELAQMSPGEFDVGIYYVRENPPQHFALTKIFDEEVCPACSPSYLAGRAITLSDLPKERLLVLEDGLRPWITWPEWFRLKGLAMQPRSPLTIASNSYLQLLHLAIMGHGIVLVWRPMIDSFVERGLLTLVTNESAEHGGSYYVLHANDRLLSPAARQFTQWLFEQRRSDTTSSPFTDNVMPFPVHD
jgi:DNA-binding transcriptional LysR family regulator